MSLPTNEISSPTEVWTPVQNRSKAFDPAAASAFGTKRTSARKPDQGRAEFTGLAATAFSSKRKAAEKPVSEAPVKEEPAKSRFADALNAMPPAATAAATSETNPMSQAFGKKRSADKSRFDETAAAAFGKKQVAQDTKETSLFDGAAAAAFGKKRHEGNDNLFDEQAASVFGKKRGDRRGREEDQSRGPTIVIEKSNTLWASISGLIPAAAKEPERQWTGSAIRQQKKKAEAEAAAAAAEAKKPLTSIEVTDESFPTLGGPSKPISKPVSKSSSGNSFSALAEDFPSLGSKPVSKSNSSTSFAEIMRKRIEQEEAEAKAEAERKARAEQRQQRELMERLNNPLIRIRHTTTEYSGNYYDEDDYNPDYNEENDLDYVHPSEMAKRGPAHNYYDDEDDYAPDDEEEDQDNTAW